MHTDAQLLEEKIESTGLKVGFIIEKLGISRTSWYKKKAGKIPFRVSEIYVISDLCNMTDEEKSKIFFSKGSV